jgi:hypothetical protein
MCGIEREEVLGRDLREVREKDWEDILRRVLCICEGLCDGGGGG